MADLTITEADVLATSGASRQEGTAGANITAGQPLYSDSTAGGKLKLADSDAEASAVAVGISLCGAKTNQPVIYMRSGTVDVGATLTVGEVYCVSTTAGGIAPVGDLTTGDYVTILGVATAADALKVDLSVSGAVKP